MSVVGFDPDRVSQLRSRAQLSLDELRRLHCDDSAAADATATLAACRRFLDGELLPAVTRVALSDALTRAFESAAPGLFSHPTKASAAVTVRLPVDTKDPDVRRSAADPAPLPEEQFRELSNAELRTLLFDISSSLRQAMFKLRNADDEDATISQLDLTDLEGAAAGLADRVTLDPAFAESILETEALRPVLAVLIPLATFPDDFVIEAMTNLLDSPYHVGPDVHTVEALAYLLAFVSRHPGLPARIGTDIDAMAAITGRLQPEPLASMLRDLLVDVMRIETQPDIDVSFGVLTQLIELHRTGRIVDPLALDAVAIATQWHLPLLSDNDLVRGSSAISPRDTSLTIGSYVDLAALYGSVMSDPGRQALAGSTIRSMLDSAINDVANDYIGADATGFDLGDRDLGFELGRAARDSIAAFELVFVDAIAVENDRRSEVADNDAAREKHLNLAIDAVAILLPSSRVLSGGKLATDAVLDGRVNPDELGWDDTTPWSLALELESRALLLIAQSPAAAQAAGVGSAATEYPDAWSDLERSTQRTITDPAPSVSTDRNAINDAIDGLGGHRAPIIDLRHVVRTAAQLPKSYSDATGRERDRRDR